MRLETQWYHKTFRPGVFVDLLLQIFF